MRPDPIFPKEITTLPEARFAFEATPNCFAKGTLVHTKEGLVPIEKLKVGDWVLSKPEDGTGEVAYKRVTHTFAHANSRVKFQKFQQEIPGSGLPFPNKNSRVEFQGQVSILFG